MILKILIILSILGLISCFYGFLNLMILNKKSMNNEIFELDYIDDLDFYCLKINIFGIFIPSIIILLVMIYLMII